MKYHEMTKNYIFREFECGLSIEETAKLCFKTVRTVRDWDKGKEIPKECRRLMRMVSGREISSHEEWENFQVLHDKMLLPTGKYISPQELLTGIALLEIQSELELKTCTSILKYARAIARMRLIQT
ncbi:phage protein [Vibrio coralliilyticus]|uniref:phage protein n=1 Tax=Vibrio coralliilyticus TaxID=190893 RepID=UPI00036675FB|nr:phage protein [Vibrio coralliilyticus]